MYLFARQGRLSSGEGLEWAVNICATVKEVSGQDVQLWGSTYSPGFGNISWTTWLPDLASLEALTDKLQADPTYNEVVSRGAELMPGGVDDGLSRPIYGAPDPDRDIQYVSSMQAVCASGNIARAMGLSVEIAQRAEALTGVQTLVMTQQTGVYGAVGWLTAHENIASVQAAEEALAADPGFVALVDSTQGAFLEDTTIGQQILWRKLA